MGLLSRLACGGNKYIGVQGFFAEEPGPDEEPDREPGPDPEPEPEPKPSAQIELFTTNEKGFYKHEPKTIASSEAGRGDSEAIPRAIETNSHPDFPVDGASTESLSQQSEPISTVAPKQPKQPKKKKSQNVRRTRTTSTKKRRATK